MFDIDKISMIVDNPNAVGDFDFHGAREMKSRFQPPADLPVKSIQSVLKYTGKIGDKYKSRIWCKNQNVNIVLEPQTGTIAPLFMSIDELEHYINETNMTPIEFHLSANTEKVIGPDGQDKRLLLKISDEDSDYRVPKTDLRIQYKNKEQNSYYSTRFGFALDGYKELMDARKDLKNLLKKAQEAFIALAVLKEVGEDIAERLIAYYISTQDNSLFKLNKGSKELKKAILHFLYEGLACTKYDQVVSCFAKKYTYPYKIEQSELFGTVQFDIEDIVCRRVESWRVAEEEKENSTNIGKISSRGGSSSSSSSVGSGRKGRKRRLVVESDEEEEVLEEPYSQQF